MIKSLKLKSLILVVFTTFLFVGCGSKEEQEYNKPANYWYDKMIKQIGFNDLDEADNTYTSLESEHRNSPYIPTAIMLLVNAHMENEEYTLANFYLDEYMKKFGMSKDIDYVRYLKVKANFLGFKYQYRDQQLIDDTLKQIQEFKAKYKDSPYMPLIDTMNSRLYMAKASFDNEIAELYKRRNKPQGTEFYEEKSKKSWDDKDEIIPPEVPLYRSIFE